MSDELEWFEAAVLDRERLGAIVEDALERVALACAREAFPHGLLVVGPEGLGRELLASESAAALTCPERAGPWCDCHSCDRARRGLHPDVAVVRPKGSSQQIKIAQIRQVVEAVPGRPFEGQRRVWVFDGAEAGKLGSEAANAFLKTLEEPPAHAVFLLLAANPAAVLPTIRSRCQQLVLPGAVAVAERFGMAGCPPELVAGDPAAADELARLARAALQDAAEGEVLPLLRLAHTLADQPTAFQALSAVAVEEAAGSDDQGMAEDLVRLASDLLRAERRARALNLNRERQVLSCLLDWHREACHGGQS
jgi:DNA polymerase-3 subunit delta'